MKLAKCPLLLLALLSLNSLALYANQLELENQWFEWTSPTSGQTYVCLRLDLAKELLVNLKELDLLRKDYSDLERFSLDQDKVIDQVEADRDRARREATVWKVVAAVAAGVTGALLIIQLAP